MQPDPEPNLLNTLTQNLTHTISILTLTQSNLDQFLQHLNASSLPMCYWPIAQLKRFSLLQKQNSTALRDFERARQSTIPRPSESKSKAPEPPPPPKPTSIERIYQNIRVETVDGKPVSTIAPTAAFMLAKRIANDLVYIARQFQFVDGIVPEEYAYVLTHDGITYEPTEYFKISYYSDEFERLCKLELETNSPHVLDGKRRLYKRIELSDT